MRLLTIAALVLPLFGTAAAVCAAEIPVTDMSRLEFSNAAAGKTTYHGKDALKMMEKEPAPGQAFAVVKGSSFHNGTIEVEVSGAPSKTADPTARGFIGVAFRFQADGGRYEMLYIRPTNGRANDQAMRNHSMQYVSAPDWGWQRLREQFPWVYESYADMQPGEWTPLRIAVRGKDAWLYVNHAEQPSLVVHDLKLGDSEGAVALWIGPGTEGYFRNLSITPDATGKP